MLKKVALSSLGFSISCLLAQPAFALEPGAAAQVPAGNTMGIPLSAPLPPGLYMTNSTKFLNGELKDDNGNDAGLDLNAIASTSIFIYTPGIKMLGGDYRAWVAVPLINVEQDIKSPFLGPVGETDVAGLGNIEVEFLDVAWALQPGIFASAGVGFIAPTGKWDENEISTGGNFWSIRPRAGYSYMRDGWNISLEAEYFMHHENDKTKYTSGDEFYLDATFLKKVNFIEGLQVGPIGYIRQQTTDDKNKGTAYYGFENGKSKQIGLGVQLLKDFGRGRYVGLSWSKDLETENTVSNDGRIALNISLPLFMKKSH